MDKKDIDNYVKAMVKAKKESLERKKAIREAIIKGMLQSRGNICQKNNSSQSN